MSEDSKKLSHLAHLASDRRFAVMLGLGFASGLTYPLIYKTQSRWFSEVAVPIQLLGLMAELTIAYKFKFVWAPLLKKYDPPLFAPLLGRARGWLLLAQLCIAGALTGIAFGDPAQWLAWTVAFSLALGLVGATQDVLIDGWRINAAPEGKQSVMASFAEIGFRLGVVCSTAGALMLAERHGWRVTYLCMAAAILPGLIATLLAPEPPAETEANARPENPPIRSGRDLLKTIFEPIKEMAQRLGPAAIPILVMIAGFRMPGYVTDAMSMPLFTSLRYTNDEIAMVTKLFGFGVAIGGTVLSGFLVTRIGMMPSLLLGTVSGSASHLALAYLAAYGGDFWTFATAASIEGFAASFATVVLITYMSTLASSHHAGSQFALLTSLCALPGSLLAGSSGYFVHELGYTKFFIGTALIGAPVALLCLYIWRRHARQEATAAA